jgi:phage protein U
MEIGTFGEIVFETSRTRIRTFDEFKRTSKARFAEHAVTGRKPVLEFLGSELDEVSLQMMFATSLGVTPSVEIDTLRQVLHSGEEQNLVVGGYNFGRFALTSMDEDWQKFDGKGRLLVAAVSIKLKEFV